MDALRKLSILGIVLSLIPFRPGFAYATASTHIWAPSTDTQAWDTGHVTADVYVPVGDNSDGNRPEPVTNSGLTFGILPFKKLTAEAGFDYKTGYGDLDRWPMYFNAKIAIPEDAYGPHFPALAFGIYDAGTSKDRTNYDLVYVKGAKTFKIKNFSLGRFSMGYFWGNPKIMLNEDLKRDNNGIFWAWERTMPEISDKLWVCAEYQGTRSGYGAFNLGASVQFTKDISVICGYQFYNNRNLADTVTIQMDINY
ncbi:MAG: hypothetical protein WC522_04785 [Candidatus Omnitrophota bacterium]